MDADMGIFIRNEATEEKIRRLARRTKQTLTAAVDHAVEAQLNSLGPAKRKGRVDRKRLTTLLAHFASLAKINEHLSDDEIIGYDEQGVPK